MVDNVGNRLGPRKTFVYESDSIISYNIQLDESVATACGLAASTNGSLPILRATQKWPLKPRYIILALESDPNVTKRAIIGTNDNSLYASNGPTVVVINGVNWVVTTRVGERRSVLTVDPPP